MADNPYRPGAAHQPPYLAGREVEMREFSRLLQQAPVLENLVLTGIRGIGKTVLMRDEFRRSAVQENWIWAGSDISEAVSVSEKHLAQRLFADLNTFSGDWEYVASERHPPGFTASPERQIHYFDYQIMLALYEQEPGLASDKIKRVLLTVWELMQHNMPGKKGIIFAWDEAQNLADKSADKEYPLGALLDVFSSLQSQGVPFMLVLTGLPTLFPKLVESRTYAERMFRVMALQNLNSDDSHKAIIKPLDAESDAIKQAFNSMSSIIHEFTRGYPYFIQFWCRELYDYIANNRPVVFGRDTDIANRISHKLDIDFFEGRWMRLTDRQRDLLIIVAHLANRGGEFTIQEIVEKSKQMGSVFSSSHANQILNKLFNKGMIFKNRHGKYILSVPLLDEYIRRQMS